MAINFYLDNKTDKKGFKPIMVSVFIAGARFRTTIGAKVNPDFWNPEKQKPKKSADNASAIESLISQIKVHFADYEQSATASRTEITPDALKAEWGKHFGKRPKATAPATTTDDEPQLTLFDVLTLFVKTASNENNWSISTQWKFKQLRTYLTEFSPNVTFDDLNEKGLTNFVSYLRDTKQFHNTTILKTLKVLKWFLRWATARGYNENNSFVNFTPKFKTATKKVVFLEWGELMRVYNYEIPANGTELTLTDCNGTHLHQGSTRCQRNQKEP